MYLPSLETRQPITTVERILQLKKLQNKMIVKMPIAKILNEDVEILLGSYQQCFFIDAKTKETITCCNYQYNFNTIYFYNEKGNEKNNFSLNVCDFILF
jgi:hypothetical protein